MVAQTLDGMLEDGFTRRMAEEYLGVLKWERDCGLFTPEQVEWAHSRGFTAESVCSYDGFGKDLSLYLSDYDYYRLWPLNSWQRIWINDKLTLKYMLGGTEFDRYLPEYYYYTAGEKLLPLMDGNADNTVQGFLNLLREKGRFACKPCNGYESRGFHELHASQDAFFIDGKETTEGGIGQFIAANPNYVFTEYIVPEESLAAIDPLIHTLRLLVVNPDGMNPEPVADYLRFGMKTAGGNESANYRPPTEADICSYNATVDLATGTYGNGKIVYANRVVDAPVHPDSKVLVEGELPFWDDVLDIAHRLSLRLCPLSFMGFDIGITPDGPKIMEINSHSGVSYLQIFKPLYADEHAAAFLRERLAEIDALDAEGRERRNRISR